MTVHSTTLTTTATVCVIPFIFSENLLYFSLSFNSVGFLPLYKDDGAKLGEAGQSNINTAHTLTTGKKGTLGNREPLGTTPHCTRHFEE